MTHAIQIACSYSELLPVDAIDDFQGEKFKERGDAEYQGLKQEILTLHFSFPIFCWKDPEDGRAKSLDGMGRIGTVRRMLREGDVNPETKEHIEYSIAGFPVVWIAARDRAEAKRKLLAVNARYGKLTYAGVYEYAKEAGISFDEVARYDLPDINMAELKVAYFDEPKIEEPKREQDTDKTHVQFDAYKNNPIKQVTLYFAGEDYRSILEDLEKLTKQMEAKDFSEVVWRLVKERVASGTSGAPTA